MSVPIITDRTRARRICPDCGVEPIGRPAAKRCIECTHNAMVAQARAGNVRAALRGGTTGRQRHATPGDIAASISRTIERDRELDRLHDLRLKGGK